MKTINQMEAEAIQNALMVNEFSITETAKALGIGRATLYRKITEFGLKLRKDALPEFELDINEELKKTVKLVEDLMELINHAADFRNGNEANGLDEGQVMASNALYIIENKLKEIKNRNNL